MTAPPPDYYLIRLLYKLTYQDALPISFFPKNPFLHQDLNLADSVKTEFNFR